MVEGVSASKLYMWRGVVAMAHADGVITPHELSFISEYMREMNLSKAQIELIGNDLQKTQDIYEMFSNITEPEDRKEFFALARAISWCDGDFDKQEQRIISNLQTIQMNEENIGLLSQSRETVSELELMGNQWDSKTNKSKGIFGFLRGLRTA